MTKPDPRKPRKPRARRAVDRPKRPDARKNAMPKKVSIRHGGGSRALMEMPLDGRTRVGRLFRQEVDELLAHLGDDASLPQRSLIDQAVRLGLLARIAWGELMSGQLIGKAGVNPAFDAYIRAAADQRKALAAIGLERRQKTVTAFEYLQGDDE